MQFCDDSWLIQGINMTAKIDAYPDLNRDLRFFPLGTENPKKLTNHQIQHYNEKGFIAPIDIFGREEIQVIRNYFDDLLPRAMAAGWNNYELTNWHKHCRGVWDIVTHSKIVDYIQDLLGHTIILRHSHFFAKLPNDGKRVSWHQDASYWPISPSKVVSAWLAIDDSNESNGAMQVIPGSHIKAQVPYTDSTKEENNVLNQTVLDPTEHGEPPVPLTLKAGQISLHSDWILHGSQPNTSKKRRCGLAMRFLSSDVRAHLGWNQHSIICRGSDPSGHWANHSRPPGELIPNRGNPSA